MRLSPRLRALRARLIGWSFVPAMAVLAGVAVFTFLAYQRVTEDLVIERDREVTYLSAARLREELSKFAELLQTLARTRELAYGSPARQQDVLAEAARRLSPFDGGVVVLNTFGSVVASQPERRGLRGQDWSDRSYFRQLLADQSVAFSNATTDGFQGAEVVAVAVPLIGDQGEFLGVVAGMFRLGEPTVSAYYASIVRLRLGQAGSTYLVDGAGRILYDSQSRFTGQPYSTPGVAAALARSETGAIRTYDADGHEILAAFAPVPGTPWMLVTEDDWAALTEPTRRYGRILLGLLILGMVLPAAGAALLARQRQLEALERHQIEGELRVASIIQKTLLPRQLPALPGWALAGHWQPARAVGGDFYDFVTTPAGNLGIVVADVTDKGIPAALVMASTRSLLRGVSERIESPGLVLARTNDLLCPDVPLNMFVTCLYAVLDPATGLLRYANAGHNPPYLRGPGTLERLEARGMPLGILPESVYEEKQLRLGPAHTLLLYSDGLVEAHDARRQMFGYRRLEDLLAGTRARGPDLIRRLLTALADFAGPDGELEDDVTLVTVERTGLT